MAIPAPGFVVAIATPADNQLSFRVGGGHNFGSNGLPFGPTAGIHYQF